MTYHLINTSPLTDRDFCYLAAPPEGTSDFSHRMAGGMAMDGDYPKNAKGKMSDRYGGMKLPSFMGNTSSFLVVAGDVKRILEQSVSKEIEYLRFTLLNHKGRPASDDYYIVNPLGTHDVLQMAKCVIDRSSTGNIISVDKIVLDPAKLAGVPDLFRIRETPREYVVSETLAALIRQAKATNFETKELDQSA